jgi:hypothetical protein
MAYYICDIKILTHSHVSCLLTHYVLWRVCYHDAKHISRFNRSDRSETVYSNAIYKCCHSHMILVGIQCRVLLSSLDSR